MVAPALPLGSSLSTSGNRRQLAADPAALDSLHMATAKDPATAVKEVARQFEGLFMQQLMKSMRQSVDSEGMLDNAGSKLGTEMLDTQLANMMTGLPNGLSSAIARQLQQQMGLPADAKAPVIAPLVVPGQAAAAAPAVDGGSAVTPSATSTATPARSAPSARQAEFVRRHGASAKAAEAATGIPAAFMVAQAAHESGWGRREIRNADGSSSHNLFGIKAGPNWKGPVATVTTTEFSGGVARQTTAKFRAYASYDESFRDYARMMARSSRYAGVVSQVASAGTTVASASNFAAGLQRAGYATDPAYADKLTQVINTTLAVQRAVT